MYKRGKGCTSLCVCVCECRVKALRCCEHPGSHAQRGIAFHHDAWQQPSLQMLYSIWKEPGVTANIWEGDIKAFKGPLVLARVFLIMNIVKPFFGCQQSGMTVGCSLTLRSALVWTRSNLFYDGGKNTHKSSLINPDVLLIIPWTSSEDRNKLACSE